MQNYHLSSFEKDLLPIILNRIPRKNLKIGEIEFLNLENHIENAYKFAEITPFIWGILYERVVGLSYERMGYSVEYNGIENGLFDLGIDLICRKQNQRTCYVQCKSGKKKIGKQAIEAILYKGGNYIAKNEETNCCFVLVIENEKVISDYNQQRFLNWNKYQSKVKLELTFFSW